ncbi:MAG: MFS transporter [bacterium]|nr:MFS transporter [bacterium]
MAYSRLIKNANFLKLWFAQITSQLAQNLLNFALIIRVFDLASGTKFANLAVSFLILSFAIPSIIFAVFAGNYIDHLDRKKVLVISNLLRAGLVLFFLVFENNLFMVYAIIFTISTITQFFFPAEAAALPNLVKDKKDYPSANSLFIFTLYSSFIVGYSLAGPIIKLFGPDAVYYFTSGAFGLAAILSMLLPKMKAITHTSIHWARLIHKIIKNITTDTKEIFSDRKLLFPILQMTLAQGIIGVIIVLSPSLANVILHQDLASASHILILPTGLGTVLGAIVIGQFMKKANKVRIIKIGIIFAGISLIFLPLTKNYLRPPYLEYATMAIAFILGFMNALVTISAQTLLQLHSEDEVRGRVFGTLNMMINIAATIPTLLAGLTADLISSTSVVLIVGMLVLAFGIVQSIIFRDLKPKGIDIHTLDHLS